MRLKLSLLHVLGHVLRVFRQKHAKNRWQRKSAITRACAAADKLLNLIIVFTVYLVSEDVNQTNTIQAWQALHQIYT